MHGLCALCGSTSAKFVCSRCKQVYYCSPEHQRQHWKCHKTVCTPPAAEPSSSEQAAASSSGTCARCLEACGPGTCRVPHPVHLRISTGAVMPGSEAKMHTNYVCGACSKAFAEVTPLKENATPTITGAVWCFEGRHSTQPLPATDQRRVIRHAVALTAGKNIQRQIDELPPPDVEILSIVAPAFGSNKRVALARPLHNLTELHLRSANFSRIVLTGETAPKLRTLELKDIPEECDLQVALPELRSATVYYFARR